MNRWNKNSALIERARKLALGLGCLLGLGACAALLAQEPSPDLSAYDAQSCQPCHLGSWVPGQPWDAAGLYPELDTTFLRAPGEQGASRVPVDTSVREWEIWQELLPKGHKRKGKNCFSCHLRDAPAEAPAMAGPRVPQGHRAPAEVVSLHRWLHTDPGWRQDALGLWVDVETYGTFLVATVKILNYGGGHRLPMGLGGENIVLELEATGDQGQPLPFLRGHRLPAWVGAPLAQRPGYLYARVLGDAQGEPVEELSQAASVLQDSRLLGDEHDELHFYFDLPQARQRPGADWRVEAKLLWRPSLRASAQEQVLMEEASAEP